ncbi:MAG: iron chelate uptake ABC transporter family permease subunit, partial [Lachnospiraceae bacterium]|nr:iron chelate uptake ABC transporter family permease subunit [Lachnospiraceae bacterium]
LGVIGFMGVICPHVAKKIWGQDHRYAIPASALTGSFLLVAADTLSRTIGHGSALPVGAVTSLAGAPFFLMLIFAKGDRR